ncbi:MAG: DedA family protein [Patescibacteria group bacterium]
MKSGLLSIISFFSAHSVAAYVALFFAMVVEGETLLIVAGVLSHIGALNYFYVILVAFLGVMVGDVLWYSLGLLLRHKNLPKFVETLVVMAERVVDKLLPHFKTKPVISLILAKFIYGTNHATLILSGLMKMDFRIFIKAELLASVIWVPIFASLGYFFGYAAIQFSQRISIFFLLILIFIVSFIALQRLFSFYYENKKDKI